MSAPATGVKRRRITVVDERGQDIESVDVNGISSTDQARTWAKRRCPRLLSGIKASDLRVYAYRDAFEDKIPLRDFGADDDLGMDKDNPMLVEAPLGRKARDDGVDTRARHLKRPKLLKEIFESLQEKRFVIFSSPPESGKSSVINLFVDEYSQCYECVVFSFVNLTVSAFDELEEEAGINLQNNAAQSSQPARRDY